MLWGGALVPEGDPVGLGELESEAVRDRVAEETVLLVPAEGLMEAEAALEVTEAATEEAAERALERAEAAEDRADEAEATADESEPDPPVRPNWGE